jgi:hypothetical protein
MYTCNWQKLSTCWYYLCCVNWCLFTTSILKNHCMPPVTSLPAKTDYHLLKLVLTNSDTSALKIIETQEAAVIKPVKAIKPGQLIAGMVFRLFGINALPGQAFKQLDNITAAAGRRVINASFNDTVDTGSKLAALRAFIRNDAVAANGEVHKNKVADYRADLSTITADDEQVVAFSKTSGNNEIAIIYNSLLTDAAEKFICLQTDKQTNALSTVYGYDACGHVHLFHSTVNGNPMSYVKVYLKPRQLVVLKNY